MNLNKKESEELMIILLKRMDTLDPLNSQLIIKSKKIPDDLLDNIHDDLNNYLSHIDENNPHHSEDMAKMKLTITLEKLNAHEFSFSECDEPNMIVVKFQPYDEDYDDTMARMLNEYGFYAVNHRFVPGIFVDLK